MINDNKALDFVFESFIEKGRMKIKTGFKKRFITAWFQKGLRTYLYTLPNRIGCLPTRRLEECKTLSNKVLNRILIFYSEESC